MLEALNKSLWNNQRLKRQVPYLQIALKEIKVTITQIGVEWCPGSNRYSWLPLSVPGSPKFQLSFKNHLHLDLLQLCPLSLPYKSPLL